MALASMICVMSGCGFGIGIGYLRPKTVVSDAHPSHLDPRNKGYFMPSTPGALPRETFTKSAVMSMWGRPDRIIGRKDGREEWIYDGAFRWQGPLVGLGILIPILIIPSGRTRTRLLFDGDRLAGATGRHSRFCFLGYLMFDNGSTSGLHCTDEY